MDETLKIRVDVQTATLRELKESLKAVNAEMLDASKSQIPTLRNEYAQIDKAIKETTGRGNVFNNFLKGQRAQNRQISMVMRELVGVTALLGSTHSQTAQVFGQSIAAFSGVEFAVSGLATALGTTSGGLGYVLGGVGAAFVLFNQLLGDSKNKTEALKAATDAYARSIRGASLGELRSLRAIEFSKIGQSTPGGFVGTPMGPMYLPGTNANEEARRNVATLDKAIEDLSKSWFEVRNEQNKTFDDLNRETNRLATRGLAVDPFLGIVRGIEKGSMRHTAAGGRIEPMVFTDEQIRAEQPLVDAFTRTFSRSLADEAYVGLSEAFNRGTSIAQRFVISFGGMLLSMFEQVFAKSFFMGILSLFSGGNFFTSFTSGFSGGGGGSAALSPVTNIGTGGGGRMSIDAGKLRLDGRDLVAGVKINLVLDRKAGGNF